jgi:MFS family permease
LRGSTASGTGLSACFQWYWFSQTLSFVGDRLTGFTAPSIAILVLHSSSVQVGLLSATGWLAYPAVGLLAGAVLAHLRRRPVLVIGELTRFAAFTLVGLLAVFGRLSFGALVTAVAVAGVATVCGDVASQSYLPSLVGSQALLAANSRLQSSSSLSKLIGPALAGSVIGLVGPYLALVLNGMPFLVSSFGQSRVRTVEAVPDRVAVRDSVLARVRDGFGYLRRQPLVRRIVWGSVVRSFGIGIVDTVLLLFAYRALALSSTGGGFLLAAGSIGGLAGAMVANRMPSWLGTRATLLLSGLEGASWLALPLCLLFAPVAVLVAIRVFSSIWLPIWAVVTSSLRQSLVPQDHHGNAVHATARTLISSATPVGSLAGGVLAGLCSAWLGTMDGLVLVLTLGGAVASCSVLVVRGTNRNLFQPSTVGNPATV